MVVGPIADAAVRVSFSHRPSLPDLRRHTRGLAIPARPFCGFLAFNPLAFLAYCGIVVFDLYALVALLLRAPRLRLIHFTPNERIFFRSLAVALIAANWLYLLAARPF